MASFIRACIRLSRSAERSAISNAKIVSLGTVELPRFFVETMESGAKMNLRFYNALVSDISYIDHILTEIDLNIISPEVVI